MTYPSKASIRGKLYEVKTDYRVALECFKVIDDPNIGDSERALAVIYILFGFISDEELQEEFLEKASYYLSCGETQEQSKNKTKDIDFNNDMKYIIPSFRSDYHIDIVATSMHWWEFVTLVSGFTENSLMNRVRDIRNYDLSSVKDQKVKRQLIEAKESVKLPVYEPQYTAEEESKIDAFEALFE